jgi:hypothetical protein
MSDIIDKLKAEIARIKLGDGDIVLVRTDELITAETGERIRQYVERTLREAGRVAPIMILDRGMQIEIIAASRLKRMPLEKLVTSIEEIGEA